MNVKMKPIAAALVSAAAFGLGSAYAGGIEHGQSKSAAAREAGTVQQHEQRASGQSQQSAPLFATILIFDQPQFVRLDADQDGRVSQQEVETVGRLQQDWKAIDTNDDGYITRDEILAYNLRQNYAEEKVKYELAAQQRTASGGAPTDSRLAVSAKDRETVGLEQSQSAAPQAGQQAQPVIMTILMVREPDFMRLDADRDGRLSRSEVQNVGQFNEVWDSVDADRNGYLSRSEIETYNRAADSQRQAQRSAQPQVLQGPPSGPTSYSINPSAGNTQSGGQK